MRLSYTIKSSSSSVLKVIGPPKCHSNTCRHVIGWAEQHEQYNKGVGLVKCAPFDLTLTGHHHVSFSDFKVKNSRCSLNSIALLMIGSLHCALDSQMDYRSEL